MNKFKLYIEYEGTRFSGWQKQPNAKTVQGTILAAAYEVFGTNKVDLQGSGRTDAGVHAICQIAHLEVKTMLAPEVIKMKINDKLPHDINILEVEKVKGDFHARHSAEKRIYFYRISKRRTAFGKNYVWWVKDKLNVNAMERAAKLFAGMHDFVSFTDDDKEKKSTKVLIDDVEIINSNDIIMIKITGSHFLWKMVRRITGVLVEVGRGKMNENDILRFLNTKSNEPAKYTAPPSGLFLTEIVYKEEGKKGFSFNADKVFF